MSRTPQNRDSGLYVRNARQSARFSQEQLARELSAQLGVTGSASTLSYYESGAHTVQAGVLLTVLGLTGVRLEVTGP
jgi:transcriptional regulator with XRE-family HTH domain